MKLERYSVFTRVQKFSHVGGSSRRDRGIRVDSEQKKKLMTKSPGSRRKKAGRAEILNCFIFKGLKVGRIPMLVWRVYLLCF